MSDLQAISELAGNPWTFATAALFMTAVTQFLKEIKKRGNENADKRNESELNQISGMLAEINENSKETVKIIAEIVNQNDDFDHCQEDSRKQLESIIRMVDDLLRMHRDTNSTFSTVGLTTKVEKIQEKLNTIELEITRGR